MMIQIIRQEEGVQKTGQGKKKYIDLGIKACVVGRPGDPAFLGSRCSVCWREVYLFLLGAQQLLSAGFLLRRLGAVEIKCGCPSPSASVAATAAAAYRCPPGAVCFVSVCMFLCMHVCLCVCVSALLLPLSEHCLLRTFAQLPRPPSRPSLLLLPLLFLLPPSLHTPFLLTNCGGWLNATP